MILILNYPNVLLRIMMDLLQFIIIQ